MIALVPQLVLAAAATLAEVLASTPGDSLALPLRRLEQRLGRSQESGVVAYELGCFHFARGEYQQAAETLARASARLEPSRKPEARYRRGLALLALRRSTEARVTFEEVALASAALRPEALLGLSYAWEQAGRPDRALDVLEALVAGDPDESGASALERIATFATSLGRADVARRAAARLRRDYPASVEAARLRLPERP